MFSEQYFANKILKIMKTTRNIGNIKGEGMINIKMKILMRKLMAGFRQ